MKNIKVEIKKIKDKLKIRTRIKRLVKKMKSQKANP